MAHAEGVVDQRGLGVGGAFKIGVVVAKGGDEIAHRVVETRVVEPAGDELLVLALERGQLVDVDRSILRRSLRILPLAARLITGVCRQVPPPFARCHSRSAPGQV